MNRLWVLLIVLVLLGSANLILAQSSVQKLNPEEINQQLIEARSLLSEDVDSSLALAGHALEAATVLQLDSAIANSHHILGIAHYLLGNYYLFAEHCKQGLATRHAATNPRFAGAMYNNKGIAYEMMNLYDEAIEAYNRSIEFEKMLGNTYGYYETIINLGKLHEAAHMYDKAEELTLKALGYFTSIADTFYMGLCYQNLGSLFFSLGDMEMHRSHMEKSLEMYYALGNRQKTAELYFNLALNYSNRGMMDEWRHYLEKADSLKGESAVTAVNILQQKGRLEMFRGNYSKAEEYLIQSIGEFRRMQQDDGLLESYRNLIRLYAVTQRIGDLDSIMAVYITATRAMQNESILNRFAELDMQFENSRIRSELEMQYYLNQKNQLRIRLLIALFVFGGIASAVIAWLYYRLSQSKQSLFKLNVEKEPLAGNADRKHELIKSALVHHSVQYGEAGDYNIEKAESLHSSIYSKALNMVREEKLYRSPGFSIDDLADRLQESTDDLAQSISLTGGMNFNAFINEFRVEEVKQRLLTEEGRKVSLDEMAKETGFPNRSTLQKVFKEFTGLTPGQFRQLSE